MKSSCVSYPKNHPLIIIRKCQVEACGGDVAAAAVLSFLEYWHDIKISMSKKAAQANDVAEKHGDGRTQDEGLWQFHSEEEIREGILGAYSRDRIREAIETLVRLEFVKVGRNPNPRYHFDRTRFFLFLPDAVTEWVTRHYYPDGRKIDDASGENGSRSSENRPRSSENRRAIPEITAETPSETPKENNSEQHRQSGNFALRPDDPPKKRTKSKRAESPDPNHSPFIQGWCREFEKHYGHKYGLQEKDAPAVSRLVKMGLSVEELLFIARESWDKSSYKSAFWCKGHSGSILSFEAKFNQIRHEIDRLAAVP